MNVKMPLEFNAPAKGAPTLELPLTPTHLLLAFLASIVGMLVVALFFVIVLLAGDVDVEVGDVQVAVGEQREEG